MAEAGGQQGFCGSPFWDYQLTWNSTDPDFTSCFQKTVLALSPVVFLLLLAPFKLYSLCHLKDRTIKWNWLNCSKLVLAGLIGVLMAIQCIANVVEQSNGIAVPPVNFVSPLIIVLALGLVSVFIFLERRKGVRTSGYLLIFWLLMLITGIVFFRSQIRHAVLQSKVENFVEFVTFTIHFVLVLASFVLSALVDKRPEFEEVQQDAHPWPENNASFLSTITFWWMTSLIIKGYKQALVPENLWSLSEENKSATVKEIYKKQWQAQVDAIKRKGLAEANGVQAEAVYKDGAVSTEVKVVGGSKTRKPSFLKTLFYSFGSTFFISVGYRMLYDVFMFTKPEILKQLIQFTKRKEEYSWHGHFYAVLMLIVSILQTFTHQQYVHSYLTMGLRMRSAIISAVYRKALMLSNSAKRTSTVGEMMNLMAVDAIRFTDISQFNTFWAAPLEIILALYFVWQLLGSAVFAGIGILVFVVPLNAFLVHKSRQLHLKQMTLKDSRIKQMNEVLNGIKVLKLYAWETSFRERIDTIHNKELTLLRKASYINAANSFIACSAPFLVALITFAVYTLVDENNVLDAEKAFVALSLFNIMQGPVNILPHAITFVIQLSVSVKRLQKFFDNDELDSDCIVHSPSGKHSIKIENGTFTWDREAPKTLTDINLEVEEGSLVAVVGAVGTGKSSLLSALLGEMDKVSGTISVKGSFAYVAQQAWIQNATLRDNILFNNEFNQETYDQVLSDCALLKDLEMLPAGDQTEIGEKGINLSGGQKQRVSLARAVYHNADVYLLDDPLSAVDSHVGKHLFDHVIGPEGQLKGKTRILVTHSISFLSAVDKIVVMKDGHISETGSFSQLMDHNGAFAEFIRNYLTEEINELKSADGLDSEVLSMRDNIIHQMDILSRSESVPSDDGVVKVGMLLQRQISTLSEQLTVLSDSCGSHTSLSHSPAKHPRPLLLQRQISTLSDQMNPVSEAGGSQISLVSLGGEVLMASDAQTKMPEEKDTNKDENAKKEERDILIEKESVETGTVKLSVFKAYFQAAGAGKIFLLIFMVFLSDGAELAKAFWLSDWSNDGYKPGVNITHTEDKRDMRLGVYGALGSIEALCALILGIWLSVVCRHAAKRLHNTLLLGVFQLPMKFFDVTPVGRIINRFSKDVDVIDNSLAHIMFYWFRYAAGAFCTILVIGVNTPIFLSVVVPLGILYFAIQRLYVPTSRQLQRLESTSRSPVFSHFGESIMGAVTIRAFNRQAHFIKQSEDKVDGNLVCVFPLVCCNRWLAVRLQSVSIFVCYFAALFAVLAHDHISPGMVGLSMSYAMDLTNTLNILIRLTCDVETNVVSVERVLEYAKAPKEADWDIPDKKPDADWPQEGVINFSNYKVRYREGLDLVLKGINCSIKSGEKIGIVGRTGAGKSSLTLALFRILEAAEGEITLDDIKIGEIGLHDLRSKLTIIPQDPVVFSGSLRMNIDPFDQYTDEKLWQALEHAHLKDFVQGLQAGLQHECTEGGENLSVGQRQLLCLARALLRKTKVLILDEATAAVDLVTDDLIQGTIRTEFAECTVLTIAHRLNTIMDYTRLMVLDKGVIAEFDSPSALLQNQNSIFYGMAKDAGLA